MIFEITWGKRLMVFKKCIKRTNERDPASKMSEGIKLMYTKQDTEICSLILLLSTAKNWGRYIQNKHKKTLKVGEKPGGLGTSGSKE